MLYARLINLSDIARLVIIAPLSCGNLDKITFAKLNCVQIRRPVHLLLNRTSSIKG